MAKFLDWALGKFGVRLVGKNSPYFSYLPQNLEESFLPITSACGAYTCTSADAQYALYRAVEYVVANQIPGDVVECGVFKGGSIMVAAMTLKHLGDQSRKLWLFDTFGGMPAPTEKDVDFKGRTPEEHLATWGATKMSDMAHSGLEEVKANLQKTGVPMERFEFVQGMVEQTIPIKSPPGAISILRLDTDWYESTLHELEHLYPKLSPGGVLIVDDYGFWRGSRQACDEYFAKHKTPLLFTRIDRIGAVIAVKPFGH